MQPRPFGTVEAMVDALDRLASLSFTTVGRVRGAFSDAQLRIALDVLHARHPLLRCRIERRGLTKTPWFVPDAEATRPTLHAEERAADDWHQPAARMLDTGAFRDAGPRLICVRLRHAADDSTLLLAFHHVVSDGKSGVLAMRDLVSALDAIVSGETPPCHVIPADAQNDYFPDAASPWKNQRLFAQVAREQLVASPGASVGLSRSSEQGPHEVFSLSLSQTETRALIASCRERGCTVHGRLGAALMLALAQQSLFEERAVRFFHPVDMRQVLRAQKVFDPAGGRDIGDAVGCYVSFVESRHHVRHSDQDPWELASEVTRQLHTRIERGVPFFSSPVLGAITRPALACVPVARREAVARSVLSSTTTGLTNLGVLERLGLDAHRGSVRLTECHFAATPSTTGYAGVSATCYDGRLRMNLVATRPGYATEALERLMADLRTGLACSEAPQLSAHG